MKTEDSSYSNLDKLYLGDRNCSIAVKGSGLVRPILQPRFVPCPCLCTGGAESQQGQTGQSDKLTKPHSVVRAWRLPFWKLPFLLPEADGEREWINRSGSHWAQVLDTGSNYNNQVKLLLIYWRFARPVFNAHNNPVSIVALLFPFYRYAKQVHMHIICISPHFC